MNKPKFFISFIGILTIFAPHTLSQNSEAFNCGLSAVTYLGKAYGTVQIGTQCWLKENLDAGTMALLTADTTPGLKIKKHCYQNKPENCIKYGALYQWDEAMQNNRGEKAQGICPQGWRIPSKSDFEILRNNVKNNSRLLKAAYDRPETDTRGFDALFGGYRGYFSGTCASLGNCALFWTSTEYNNDSAINLYLTEDNDKISFDDNYKTNGFSVRCLKDD